MGLAAGPVRPDVGLRHRGAGRVHELARWGSASRSRKAPFDRRNAGSSGRCPNGWADTYRLRSLVSAGFATVYLARDDELGRQVAIKVPHAQIAGSRGRLESLAREARLAAGLRHPAIVRVLDISPPGEEDLFVVLEYVERADPRRSVARREALRHGDWPRFLSASARPSTTPTRRAWCIGI